MLIPQMVVVALALQSTGSSTAPARQDAAGATTTAPPVAASASPGSPASPSSNARTAACRTAGWPEPLAEQAGIAVTRLLAMEESPGQWPYEGVYRVGGEIPVGYRIGGTAITLEALMTTPGVADDPERRAAIERGLRFICETRAHKLMDPISYEGGYDVRGWGHCYGARALLLARGLGLVPDAMKADVEAAIDWYVDALQRMEIAEVGGWNYALRGARTKPSPASPFMTAPCVEVLMLAASQGETVDPAILTRALDALERMRAESGYVDYSAAKQIRDQPDQIPGAVGRMCAVETALLAAGRGSPERAAQAVRAFGDHWEALEARRAKSGTHLPPYGVAPYYFMYAHWRAALAVQAAPESQRKELRAIVLERLGRTRSPEGTWNDRVFDRSANFGTACALLTLGAPWKPLLPAPATHLGQPPIPATSQSPTKN